MYDLNRARWYVNRLTAMSPSEFGARVQERILVAQEKLTGLPDLRIALDEDRYWEQFLNEESSHFFFKCREQLSWQQQFKIYFPQELDACLKTANSLVKGQIQLFKRDINLGEKITWQRDPLTKKQWPADFYANIDTRDGQLIGGVKWVWELNRHHQFVTLGKAYFLTGDEIFAQALCDQWQRWILDNPPLFGVNWTSPLEMALRLINWTWSITFIRLSPVMTKELFTQILQSIAQQATFISRHLSAHSSANNHLIGEAAGLAVIGLCFPWLPEATKWRQIGLHTLERELELQITSAGIPAEQAISYLSFILDFNLIIWRLADLNAQEVPAIWFERLSAAADFIIHLLDDAGHIPAIGDSDDAWVVRLDDRQDVTNYQSILATAAVLLARPDLKACARRWDEKSHWLLGEEGRRIFTQLPAAKSEPGSRLFSNGGYAVMRGPGRVLVADCGPLGYLSTAAHGHADALSLTLSVDNKPFLVDPGTYAYQEGGDWRDYFRSTSAHNTVVVDGQNQSEIKGTFLWGRKAKARVLSWQPGPDLDIFMAEHDGYAKFGVIHKRVVLFHKPDLLLIGDELLGNGHHLIEQLWHLFPSYRAEIVEDRIKLSNSKHMREMKIVDGSAEEVSIHCGEKDPIQGWYSPHYGQKIPAPVIRIAGQRKLPARITTIFSLNDSLRIENHAEKITKLMRTLNDAWEQR